MRKKIKRAWQNAPANLAYGAGNLSHFGKAYGEKAFVAPVRDAVTKQRIFDRLSKQKWAEGQDAYKKRWAPEPWSPEGQNIRNLNL